MEDKLSDVAKLLLARMDSHPEEFEDSSLIPEARVIAPTPYRWHRIVSALQQVGSDEDRNAVNTKLQQIHIRQLHRIAMDELLNGPERRRNAEEEWRRQTAASQSQSQSQYTMQQNLFGSAKQNLVGIQNISGHLGLGL